MRREETRRDETRRDETRVGAFHPSAARPGSLLHCIASHCIALHRIASHRIPFHSIPFHSISFHCIPLHSIALHYITLHDISIHYSCSPRRGRSCSASGTSSRSESRHRGAVMTARRFGRSRRRRRRAPRGTRMRLADDGKLVRSPRGASRPSLAFAVRSLSLVAEVRFRRARACAGTADGSRGRGVGR